MNLVSTKGHHVLSQRTPCNASLPAYWAPTLKAWSRSHTSESSSNSSSFCPIPTPGRSCGEMVHSSRILPCISAISTANLRSQRALVTRFCTAGGASAMARCTSRAAAAAAPPSSDAASCARASASARSRASASALRRASRTFSSPSSESEPSLDESTSDLEPPAAATSSRTLSALRTTSHAAVAVAMAWSAASLTAAAMSLKTSETRDMSEASCGAPTAAVRRDPDGGSFARERMREALSLIHI